MTLKILPLWLPPSCASVTNFARLLSANYHVPSAPPAIFAKKAGATKEIQSAEEGGSLLKSARARKDFQSHFSRSLFWKNFLETCFGVLLGV